MCEKCASFNWEKRNLSVDMLLTPEQMAAFLAAHPSGWDFTPAGSSSSSSSSPSSYASLPRHSSGVRANQRVALVTGGRIKIGYYVAVKLLRAGCFVIATSRFPRDAALSFAAEKDYDQWKESLRFYGYGCCCFSCFQSPHSRSVSLDLRLINQVEEFCQYLSATYPRLDILINNAAQTIRRPPAFYQPTVELEAKVHNLLTQPVRVVLFFLLLSYPLSSQIVLFLYFRLTVKRNREQRRL
jgi:hypothetical protein